MLQDIVCLDMLICMSENLFEWVISINHTRKAQAYYFFTERIVNVCQTKLIVVGPKVISFTRTSTFKRVSFNDFVSYL